MSIECPKHDQTFCIYLNYIELSKEKNHLEATIFSAKAWNMKTFTRHS